MVEIHLIQPKAPAGFPISGPSKKENKPQKEQAGPTLILPISDMHLLVDRLMNP
jgi:hypothetical protein